MKYIPYLTEEKIFKLRNENKLYKVLDGNKKTLYFYRYKNYYKVKYTITKYETDEYYVFNIFENEFKKLLKRFNDIIYLINKLDYIIYNKDKSIKYDFEIELYSTIIKYKKLRYVSNIELKPKILNILTLKDFAKQYLKYYGIDINKLKLIYTDQKIDERLKTIEEECIYQGVYNLLEEVNDIINNISN
jgi:hypothetical protein